MSDENDEQCRVATGIDTRPTEIGSWLPETERFVQDGPESSALEVLTIMRSINLHFTYLLIYLLTVRSQFLKISY